MKIETQVYGVFTKDGEKWRGPVNGEFNEEEILQEGFDSVDDYARAVARDKKKKVKVFRQVWVNDEEV